MTDGGEVHAPESPEEDANAPHGENTEEEMVIDGPDDQPA